jgi:hypothetical protein
MAAVLIGPTKKTKKKTPALAYQSMYFFYLCKIRPDDDHL